MTMLTPQQVSTRLDAANLLIEAVTGQSDLTAHIAESSDRDRLARVLADVLALSAHMLRQASGPDALEALGGYRAELTAPS